MKRRKFLVSAGSTAAAGSGIIGSGAFSRTESDRSLSVQVANDQDAYVELNVISGSLNSTNYVDGDDNGHLEIVIDNWGSQGGDGANSDSQTFWDDLFKICNRGKAEEVDVYVADTAGIGLGDGKIAFYTGDAANSQGDDGADSIVGQANSVSVPLGECQHVGLRSNSRGVNALEEKTIFDGNVTIVADADGGAGAGGSS